MQDIHIDIINSLDLQGAVESYPRLDNLQHFRRLNDFIENTFNEKIEEIGSVEVEEVLSSLLMYGEQKRYKSFRNLVRPSLLITLCSFIENIFTYPVNSNKKLKKEFDAFKRSKKQKGSHLFKAKKVLINNGFEELQCLDIEYVDDMNYIRNSFVHDKGEVTDRVSKKIKGLTSKYDFEIGDDNQIILGEKFIENYITHLEKFAVEVAEIIYENESWIHKMQQKFPDVTYRKFKDAIEFMKKHDITLEQLSSIKVPNKGLSKK